MERGGGRLLRPFICWISMGMISGVWNIMCPCSEVSLSLSVPLSENYLCSFQIQIYWLSCDMGLTWDWPGQVVSCSQEHSWLSQVLTSNLGGGAFKKNVCLQCQCYRTGEGAFIKAGTFIMAFTVFAEAIIFGPVMCSSAFLMSFTWASHIAVSVLMGH